MPAANRARTGLQRAKDGAEEGDGNRDIDGAADIDASSVSSFFSVDRRCSRASSPASTLRAAPTGESGRFYNENGKDVPLRGHDGTQIGFTAKAAPTWSPLFLHVHRPSHDRRGLRIGKSRWIHKQPQWQ